MRRSAGPTGSLSPLRLKAAYSFSTAGWSTPGARPRPRGPPIGRLDGGGLAVSPTDIEQERQNARPVGEQLVSMAVL